MDKNAWLAQSGYRNIYTWLNDNSSIDDMTAALQYDTEAVLNKATDEMKNSAEFMLAALNIGCALGHMPAMQIYHRAGPTLKNNLDFMKAVFGLINADQRLGLIMQNRTLTHDLESLCLALSSCSSYNDLKSVFYQASNNCRVADAFIEGFFARMYGNGGILLSCENSLLSFRDAIGIFQRVVSPDKLAEVAIASALSVLARNDVSNPEILLNYVISVPYIMDRPNIVEMIEYIDRIKNILTVGHSSTVADAAHTYSLETLHGIQTAILRRYMQMPSQSSRLFHAILRCIVAIAETAHPQLQSTAESVSRSDDLLTAANSQVTRRGDAINSVFAGAEFHAALRHHNVSPRTILFLLLPLLDTLKDNAQAWTAAECDYLREHILSHFDFGRYDVVINDHDISLTVNNLMDLLIPTLCQAGVDSANSTAALSLSAVDTAALHGYLNTRWQTNTDGLDGGDYQQELDQFLRARSAKAFSRFLPALPIAARSHWADDSLDSAAERLPLDDLLIMPDTHSGLLSRGAATTAQAEDVPARTLSAHRIKKLTHGIHVFAARFLQRARYLTRAGNLLDSLNIHAACEVMSYLPKSMQAMLAGIHIKQIRSLALQPRYSSGLATMRAETTSPVVAPSADRVHAAGGGYAHTLPKLASEYAEDADTTQHSSGAETTTAACASPMLVQFGLLSRQNSGTSTQLCYLQMLEELCDNIYAQTPAQNTNAAAAEEHSVSHYTAG